MPKAHYIFTQFISADIEKGLSGEGIAAFTRRVTEVVAGSITKYSNSTCYVSGIGRDYKSKRPPETYAVTFIISKWNLNSFYLNYIIIYQELNKCY